MLKLPYPIILKNNFYMVYYFSHFIMKYTNETCITNEVVFIAFLLYIYSELRRRYSKI